MKTRLLSLLLLIASAAFPATAYDFMVDGIAYYKNGSTSVMVTYQNYSSPRYTNLNGALTIPASVTYNGSTYSVTAIGFNAFTGCSGLTSVIIPSSVTKIYDEAFSGCSGLTSVTIPSSVTLITSRAFLNCTGLTSVNISDLSAWCNINFGSDYPDDIYWSGTNPLQYSNLYLNGSKITNLAIPNSVTVIKNHTFHDCSGLTSVTIPNSVTSIGSGAFCNCTGLTLATIGNSVTSIGSYVFCGCSSLNTAIIGENVTSIGEYAFMDCSFLENLVAMRERPIIINSNVFEGIPKSSCDLHVREGSKIRYENQDVWKDFLIIIEDAENYAETGGGTSGSGVYGDVNGDGVVTAADVTAIYNILLRNE